MANASDIDVHEMMFGVVADSAVVKVQGGVAKGERGNAGNADIDGVSESVHAVRGDPAGGAMQECVGLGRTVSADNVNQTAGMTDCLVEFIEQIEEARIHIAILVNAPIAEEAIEFCFRGWQVVIALAVDKVEGSARVQVV